jgi:hypothetical protein
MDGSCAETAEDCAACPAGTIADCSGDGDCGYDTWLGDGYCDDGTWGLVFTCDEYGNDCGDCGTFDDPYGACDGDGGGGDGEMKIVKMVMLQIAQVTEIVAQNHGLVMVLLIVKIKPGDVI